MSEASPDSASSSSPRWRPLASLDRRVVGVLVEKAKTTPDGYPMSVNALRSGCNQKNNRAPLMEVELEDIEEKPSVEKSPSNLAVAARYVFKPDIFNYLVKTRPGKGGEIQLTDAIRLMIQAGGKVLGVQLGGGERRYDIGNFDSYFQAFVEFALADPKHGPGLREHVRRLLTP